MPDLVFCKPRKEYAYLRHSRKRQFGTDHAHGCRCVIQKGEYYVEDNISKIIGGKIFWLKYKICLDHWRLPLPKSIEEKITELA